MKILHVTDASAAGVLTSVTTLTREQAKGSDVTFGYVPRHESPPHDEIVRAMGAGVRTIRWDGKPRELALMRGLLRLLVDETFDVVHLHSSRAGLLGRIASRVRNVPVVYSPHGFAFARRDFGSGSKLLYRLLERVALHWGDGLVLVSESEQELAHRALPRARTEVLSNAVDCAELDECVPVARRCSSVRVVHIGRIAPTKRPDQFSAVAKRVRLSRGNETVGFRWIGDGDRSLLGEDIDVTGWLDHSSVLAEIAAADLVLFTSFSEGLPMALAEAQGLGVPVVASRVAGVRDVVLDGQTGVLADSEDELVSAVLGLIAKPETRARMSLQGKTFVRESFNADRLGSQSLEIYRSLGVLPTDDTVAAGTGEGKS